MRACKTYASRDPPPKSNHTPRYSQATQSCRARFGFPDQDRCGHSMKAKTSPRLCSYRVLLVVGGQRSGIPETGRLFHLSSRHRTVIITTSFGKQDRRPLARPPEIDCRTEVI